jgi:energy-coupling factor transport system ATP-binding protein
VVGGSSVEPANHGLINLDGVSVTYHEGGPPILDRVHLSIRPGELVVIAGPSGSGKSTLCSLLGGVIPHLRKATVEGRVEICGLDTKETVFPEIARIVATVFQNPETNLFALKAVDDIAFGPENLGSDNDELRDRVGQAIEWTNSWDLLTERTVELSGGQKQRLAVASSLANNPKLLILDEPTTDLDPIGKSEVVDMLVGLRSRHAMTLVVVEHDLSRLVGIADRLVVMDRGRIVLNGPPVELLEEHRDKIRRLGVRIPGFVEVWYMLKDEGVTTPLFLNDAELARALEANPEARRAVAARFSAISRRVRPLAQTIIRPEPIVELRDITFRYPGRPKPTLNQIDLRIEKGEIVGLVGPNGAGKSTLLQVLMGLRKPSSGEIFVAGHRGRRVRPHRLSDRVGYGFQNPDHQLFEQTVRDECAFTLRRRGFGEAEVESRVDQVLKIIGLDEQGDRHPATLSRGEKRRLAVATALVLNIEMLLMDEPTTGQDARTLEGLFELICSLNEEAGTTVVMVTHDMDVVWKYATRVICVKDGEVFFDGIPEVCLSPANAGALRDAQLQPPLASMAGLAETTIGEGTRSV